MRISDWSSDVCSSDLAMKVLGEHIVEEKDPAAAAADSWLGLSPEEREATAVFASGRDARETINKRIQAGLIAEGSVKGEALQLTVYDRVNTTREELRYASTYRPGQTLEVGRGGAQDVGIQAARHHEIGRAAGRERVG